MTFRYYLILHLLEEFFRFLPLKCWFIELNLLLGWDMVCVKSQCTAFTFLAHTVPEFHNWSDVALSDVSCIDESVCHIGGFEMGFQIWEWETLQKVLQARDTLCICQQGNCVRFCQICIHKLGLLCLYTKSQKKKFILGKSN